MILRLCISLLLCLLALSCANVQPPSGGPEDKEAPFVDTAAIGSGTTNFRESSVWLHFSEYVDKGRVTENILISPEKRLEYSWSGKELEIRFAEPLDSNTTYALSLGTDYNDLHGNKPKEAHTIVFSTGSALDSGMISGTLFDASPSGAYIFLYPLTGINPDTLDFSHTKPRYRTQVGSNGSFSFKALPKGNYRLIAVRDEVRNGLYDDNDAFGTTVHDIEVAVGTTALATVRINPMPDIQPPQLVEVRPKTRSRIEALFSEEIDTLSISPASWRLSDSAGRLPIEIRAAYITPGNPKSVTLITEQKDSSSFLARLIASKGNVAVCDTARNKTVDTLSTQVFRASSDADTLSPQLLPMAIRDSARNQPLKPTFRLLFTTAVLRNEVESKVGLFKQNTRIDAQLEWRGDNEVRISPKDSLAPDTWYELRFRMNGIHAYNGISMKDSTMRLRFSTTDTRNLGMLKGVLVDSAMTGTTKAGYVITLTDKNKMRRSISLTQPGAFSFPNVPEGEYSLEAFYDANGNGVYTAGTPKPFTYAERFVTRESTVSIKARWTVEDIKIQFGK